MMYLCKGIILNKFKLGIMFGLNKHVVCGPSTVETFSVCYPLHCAHSKEQNILIDVHLL